LLIYLVNNCDQQLIEDTKMNDFRRDVLLGLMFISGIFGFISGEFVISTILFASAAIYSNIAIREKTSSIRTM
jgi:hypothetical protein